MGVLFDFIPGAGLVAPGTFFEVKSGGQFESQSIGVIVGLKAAAGTLADNVLTPCATVQEAATFFGLGSLGYEAYRVARMNAPAAQLYVVSIPVSGNAGAWTVSVGSLPAAAGDGVLEIAGRRIPYAKAASETATQTATGLAAAINAFVDPLTLAYLPVTASAAAAVVTLTARHPGAIMSELEIFADPAIAGNIFAGAVLTITNTVPPTGAPTITAALAALGELPFDWIVSPFGDATNMASATAAFSDVSGRWAWNQQFYGHYFTVNTGNTAAQVSYGQTYNDRHLSALARTASPTPSWEWLAGYVGRILPWLTDDTNGNAARNQSDLAIEGVRPPRDRSVWPNYATRNSLNVNGMSTWAVSTDGRVTVNKAVTMQRLNAQGQPDTAFRDIQAIAQVIHCLRYMRAGLGFRHSNKAVADANPSNIPTISTPADIKADCIALYGDLVSRGLFENTAEFARRVEVSRDASNPARVNIGMDLDRVNPLDILAASARIYAQYPRA
jgi:phage tail sheath gpL-like